MSRSPLKNIVQVVGTAANLAAFRYPRFVYGLNDPACIPVFCMHGVEQQSFEAMIRFLETNGYNTPIADEYLEILTGNVKSPNKSILLTFDDGWSSLYTVAFPLLKQSGLRIVVFIPPGRIQDSSDMMQGTENGLTDSGKEFDNSEVQAPSPAPGRVRAAKQKPKSRILNPEACLLSWPQIREMSDSGLVDFQSHTLNHNLVFRNSRLVDYLNPTLIQDHGIMEFPNGMDPCKRLGAPIFETTSRLSDTPALTPDPRIADQCVEFVSQHGGPEFFLEREWRDRLGRLLYGLMAAPTQEWHLETPEEQREAIRFELTESKRLIEEHLPGKSVRHICWPWHEAGEIAVEESRKAGYAANFWGRVNGRYSTPIPGNPFKIARVGGDFFFRLPGNGRISLLNILLKKTAGRMKAGSPYVSH
jgi:hypothetical protein